MIWMIRCYRWKPQFEYKEDKATTQILNLNTKTIENKHFILYLKRFLQPLSVCFCNATNLNTSISVWTYSCPKFQCLYIFKNLCVDCFRYKLLSVWSYIFLLNGPDKKPKQNDVHSNKKPKMFAGEPPKLFWRVVTGTLRWLAGSHYLLYFLAFDWLRPAGLFSWIGQFAYL